MSTPPKIVTNNHRRDVVYDHELTAKERAEFDYIDWAACERGEDQASFFRFKGELYDIHDFSTDWGLGRGSRLPEWARGWDGYTSDSAFSGMLIKFDRDDTEFVIVGQFFFA